MAIFKFARALRAGPLLTLAGAWILLFFSVCTYATELGTTPIFGNELLYEISPKEKVLNSVLTISQDRNGFLWFGTSRGLARFDGVRTKVFASRNLNGTNLSHNWVNKIFQDPRNIFWVGTKSGLQLFDPDLEEFIQAPELVRALQSLDGSDVRYVVGDAHGSIWAGTSRRVLQLEVSSGKSVELDIWQDVAPATISCLYVDLKGALWICYDGGVARVEKQNLQVTHFRNFVDIAGRAIADPIYPSSITMTGKSEILIGTQLGLAKIDLPLGRANANVEMLDEKRIPKLDISRVLTSRDGSVWVASSKRGLYRRFPGAIDFKPQLDNLFPKDAVCDANIVSLYEAQGGVLWMGGWQREPCHLDTQQLGIRSFVSNEGASKGKRLRGFRSITEDEYGVLVLTRDKRLVRPFNEGVGPVMYSGKTALKKIFRQERKIWGLDSFGLGLLSLQTGELQYRCIFEKELELHVESLVTDHKGMVWFSTEEGLVRCDMKTGKVERFKHDASNKNSLFLDEIYPLAVDQSGDVWMGTHLGLQRYDLRNGEFTFFSNASFGSEQLQLNTVYAIATNSLGEIWVGIEDGVVIGRVSKKGSFEFEKRVRLPAVYAIQFLENGDAWLSSANGLVQLAPSGKVLRFVNEKEGVEPGEFLGMESFLSRDGDLIFSSVNFAYFFNPKLLQKNDLEPEVIATGFKADFGERREKIDPNVMNFLPSKAREMLTLPSDTYAIHIDLADLNFSKNSLTKIQVKLDGFDLQWRDVDLSRMQVTYMNLPHGSYRLLARASYGLSFSGNESTILHLLIPPPIWKTWWMRTIFFLVFIFALALFYQLKVRSLKRAKHSLEAIVRARTAELAEQNKNKSKFIADAAHDLRQPMQAIGNLLEAAMRSLSRADHAKSRELLELACKATELMRSSFHSVLELSRVETGMISPRYENIDLNELITEVLPTFEIMARDVNVQIRYQASRKLPQAILTDRHFTSRILANLVGNAIKYRDTSKASMIVEIRCVTLNDVARLYIVDNGVGIPSGDIQNIFRPFFQVANIGHDREKGLGLGLSIVDAMCKAMKGHDLGLTTNLTRGTKIWIDFPLGDRTYSQENTMVKLGNDATGIGGIFVIYVEDDDLVRASTFSILTAYGLLCESFQSFEELSKALPSIDRIPDLILTDHRLSQVHDSGDVIDQVRQTFDYPVPAIILTGESVEIEADCANKANMILYKPVGVDQLMSAISSLRPNMPSNVDE
jgi:signal transduction histidine kinase/ligand-binding sensor domain-containing protein/CheY-like chemotaxis protein